MKGEKINLRFGLEYIYNDASFILDKSDKVGIVGVNGAGKSTLFKCILGEVSLDSGKIQLPKGNIGY